MKKIIILALCLSLNLSAGYFISIGNGAHRMYSEDGIIWTDHHFLGKPKHDQNDLKAIAHGNDITVVVGGFSRSNIFITEDGKSWEKSSFNIGVLSGVVFTNKKFYIFGEGGRVASSKDGKKWKQIADAQVYNWGKEEGKRLGVGSLKVNVRMWKHTNGIFVGAGDNGVICTTENFKKFEIQKAPGNIARFRTAAGNGVFVIADNNKDAQKAFYSTDGKGWRDVSPKLAAGDKIRDVVFDGDRFILLSRKYAWESKDGQNWKKIKGASFSGSLIVTPKAYFLAGPWYSYTDNPKVSFDKGKTWKDCKFPTKAAMRYVIYVEE